MSQPVLERPHPIEREWFALLEELEAMGVGFTPSDALRCVGVMDARVHESLARILTVRAGADLSVAQLALHMAVIYGARLAKKGLL